MNPDALVRRVLIYRVGSLGDTVVALPCFHLIERAFPQALRVLLTDVHAYTGGAPAMALLGGSGLVHGELSYPGGTHKFGEMLRLWWTVRSFKADVLVYLMPIRSVKSVRRDKLFFWLTGVRRIVGLPSEQENEYDFDPSTGLYETEASRLSRCLAELGEARLEDAASWWLRLSAEEQLAAVIALEPAGSRPVIAVSLGTKWQPNDWGAQNWLKLLSRLAEKWPTHALVLLGAANEREKCEDAAEGWRKSGQPVINLCGKMTPRQSAAVLIKAELFLGHDSGPMHLAAAMQVPCVAVFSARNLPGKWFPSGKRHRVIYHRVDCMGCGLVSCIEEKKRCILSVTVGEMEEAANSILSDKLIVERNS